jgi:site-specific DNA recombinase
MVRTIAKVNGRTYKRFVCSTYKKLGKEACSSHIISEDVLLEVILAVIQAQINCAIDSERFLKKTQQEIIKAKEKIFYSNKIKHIKDEIYKIGKLKRGLYEDYKAGIITFDEYTEMKPEYEKVYLKKENELKVQEEYFEIIKEREYSGNEYIKNFKKHCNITELSREVILNLIDDVIVYKDKQIKIKFKFKDEYKKIIYCPPLSTQKFQ